MTPSKRNKHKFSSTQIWVMAKLKNGEVLHWIDGINARCFFPDANVGWPTIFKLEEIGLIERKDGKVELTEFGNKFPI